MNRERRKFGIKAKEERSVTRLRYQRDKVNTVLIEWGDNKRLEEAGGGCPFLKFDSGPVSGAGCSLIGIECHFGVSEISLPPRCPLRDGKVTVRAVLSEKSVD